MDTINSGIKKCSYCGEDIGVNARRCPYCGSLVEVKISEFPIRNEPGPQNIESAVPSAQEGQEVDSGSVSHETQSQEDYKNDGQNLAANVNNELSNGLKVFLTVIASVIPGIGQLIGIIAAIVFINSSDNKDKKSFGVALLVASVVMFVLTSLFYFIIIIALSLSA